MSDQWETFCDVDYYHMWRLRRENERGWNNGFHINTRDEAQTLCGLLNKLELGLTQATTNLHEVSCKLLVAEKKRDESREFARQLERELAAVTKECNEYKDLLIRVYDDLFVHRNMGEAVRDLKILMGAVQLTDALAAVTEERDRLAESLREIADCDFVITLPDRMDAVRAIARGALGDINWYKS